MKGLLLLAASLLCISACGDGPLNSKACANHESTYCGQGMRCQVMGDFSKCVPTSDAGLDGAGGDASAGAETSTGGVGGGDASASETTDAPADVVSPIDSPTGNDSRVDMAVDTVKLDTPGPSCGDHVTTPPEECDLGTAMNTGAYGGCTSECKFGARCGDGTKNGPEQCDNGAANNDTLYNGCKTNCMLGPRCGDGHVDSGEECDQGAANSATAYGKGLCTTACKNAPFCGDGKINGSEVCDGGGSGSTDLGACNPECYGYYEKKTLLGTVNLYTGKLGGPAGADQVCVTEFGAGWKAVLVGGSRRATTTPFKGDGQDWVLHKYTHYYNGSNQLVWRNDEIPLIGVHNGQQQATYADAFAPGHYPWAGWAKDWTTLADSTNGQGTCMGWTSDSPGDWGNFADMNLAGSQSESCGSMSWLLCAQQ